MKNTIINSVSEKLVKRDSDKLRKNGEQLKAIRLQKESEWEKNIKEVADELWELLPPDFLYKKVDRKTAYNWIKTRLENLLSTREKEISEEIEKMKTERDETIGFSRGWNVLKGKVLSILKHQ